MSAAPTAASTAAAPDPAPLMHSLDRPFMPFEEWLDQLEEGTCTRCGQAAERGFTRWWHLGPDCVTGSQRPLPARIARFRGN